MKLIKNGIKSEYISGGIICGANIITGGFSNIENIDLTPLVKLKSIIMKDIITKDTIVGKGGTGMDIDVAG